MADNFGRMQLADYLVSYALQTLNRCLLKLGSAETLSVKDQRLLRDQIAHLQSLWQLMQRSVAKVERDAANARLREATAMLAGADPELLAGRQLLESAEGRVRAVLEGVVDGYALREDVAELLPERRDRLSTLLQAESACWRDYPALRQVSEPALIEHGMGRAYAKARRLALRLDEAGRAPPGPKRLARTHGWVGHAANHLDVLRPGLDDSGRAQRWHLRRLHGKLEQQLGLELLARRLVKQPVRPKVKARMVKQVDRQRRHLAKQRAKLAAGAFSLAPQAFETYVLGVVKQLGLDEITLLPLDSDSGR